MYSLSGKSPTVNTTLTDFRKYATARGDGYELFSFYPLTLLQCMFLLVFKNRDGQTALGQGYTSSNDSSGANTGATNSSGFMYGSTSATTHIKFLGIEDFWGNCYYWVDGIYCDSSYNILTYYKDMTGTDSGAGYQYSCSSGVSSANGSWMNNIIGTNHGGFVGNEFSGSSSTYYADHANLCSYCCALFGGYWDDESNTGAFYLYVAYDASNSYPSLAARLVYKHVAQ